MATKKIELRAAYGYDTDKVSNETGIECKDISLTQQHQKEEADINVIVKRFGLTGQLPQNVRMPQYGDFTNIGSYQEALNSVMAAESAFMSMPADVRTRFDNDPEKFVAFCIDPANLEEAEKLGLTAPKKTPEAPTAPPEGAEGVTAASPPKSA